MSDQDDQDDDEEVSWSAAMREVKLARVQHLDRSLEVFDRIESMRQRDHSARQEVELDYLLVMAIRRSMLLFADVVETAHVSESERIRARVAAMPLPGQAAVIRPPSMRDWPERLVDLATRGRRGSLSESILYLQLAVNNFEDILLGRNGQTWGTSERDVSGVEHAFNSCLHALGWGAAIAVMQTAVSQRGQK